MQKPIKANQIWQNRRNGSLIEVVNTSDNLVQFRILSHKNRNLCLACGIENWHDKYVFIAEDFGKLPAPTLYFYQQVTNDTLDKSCDEEKQLHASLTARDICQQAIEIMKERGKTYDKPNGGERSMLKTVTAFNALTGHELTEEQGWQFMTILKLARSQQGEYKADNYLDGTAYFALAGECASVERTQ